MKGRVDVGVEGVEGEFSVGFVERLAGEGVG